MKTRQEIIERAIKLREERVRARYAQHIEQFEADVLADSASERPNGFVEVDVSELSMRAAYQDRRSHDFLWLLTEQGYRITYLGMDARTRTVRVRVSWQ